MKSENFSFLTLLVTFLLKSIFDKKQLKRGWAYLTQSLSEYNPSWQGIHGDWRMEKEWLSTSDLLSGNRVDKK